MNRIFLIAGSSLALVFSAQAAHVLTVTELGEKLTANYDGTSLNSFIVKNGPENWDLVLPEGFAFNQNIIGGSFFVDEPEGGNAQLTPSAIVAPLVNVVTIRDATTLNWVSEFPLVPTTLETLELPPLGGTVAGNAFTLVLQDLLPPAAAPDGGSTLALSAIGFGLIAAARRKLTK